MMKQNFDAMLKFCTSSTIFGALFAAHIFQGALGSGVKIDGDVILGGLFPVHEKGETTSCSSTIYNRGIQRLEAMLYAVDLINKDTTLLPYVSLGVNILDTCSKDTYALNQSLEFIRGSLDAMDVSGLECSDKKPPRVKYHAKPVKGVIGGSYSSVSQQVANLFRLFRIPQISPASTAKALSDKDRFEFFARTVPPDTFQVRALVDILQVFNWSYVSAIYSEGSYGESGFDEFHKLSQIRNICIALATKIPHNANHNFLDSALRSHMKKTTATAMVLFTRMDDTKKVLEAAGRLGAARHFHWVGSDGWGKQRHLVEGLEDVAEGAITIELTSKPVEGFNQHMKSLTPEGNVRNPWFVEYWETFFGCHLNTRPTEDLACDPDFRLSVQEGFQQDSKVQFVVDGVFAFAHALQALHDSVCRGQTGMCEQMRRYDGGDFYREYLLKVNFTNIVGSQVKFDERGDGPSRYTIYNFRKISHRTYNYTVVGLWDSHLDLDPMKVVFSENSSEAPSSVCSHPCKVGEIKIMQQGDTCCWICTACKPYEMMVNQSACKDCGPGWWPHDNMSSCYKLPHRYMKWDTLFALVPMAISCVGSFFTLTVIGIFLKYHDTPVVKASGRELSYMLLCGILICYLNTFLLIATPGVIICACQRFGVGFGFSLIYSALLTKTNRISRIFDSASRSARRPGFISPKSQVIITCFLVSIQVAATIVWLILEEPGARFEYPSRREVILKCRIKDSSFMVSLVYNMVLITTCTIYAIKTRKIPENFNESKFIGFTMYTTCIIWLAFVPIYFGTGNTFEVQITTLCISISLSATVALICLYSPKIYIIIYQPEKNVRKLTMNSAIYKKSQTHSTGASFDQGSDSVRFQAAVPSTPSKTRSEGTAENESFL
ncbi:metabotropic glutamate receptor [Hyalella azteca]|uniref:Metabotropic glutamate receptor n=1 Tax=Hyalella azteca TaxID=294128 RepID=A0A8B7NIP8_HYAAZ|nr:metabotropic glutamate receptor [Hyalella azteca]